ncbi:MAG: hypothetical protein KGL02_14490, partial [Acidobacteriota bacterium]|nr:hypothetical protein [Acidobacteriota bacterium]
MVPLAAACETRKNAERVTHGVMEEHNHADSQHLQKAVMFFPVMQHRALLGNSEANRVRGRRLSAIVYGARAGIKEYLPAGVAS